MKNPPKDIIAHTPGTNKGEEWLRKSGYRDPGFEGATRTARDATSVGAEHRRPIDPRMPHLPPP